MAVEISGIETTDPLTAFFDVAFDLPWISNGLNNTQMLSNISDPNNLCHCNVRRILYPVVDSICTLALSPKPPPRKPHLPLILDEGICWKIYIFHKQFPSHLLPAVFSRPYVLLEKKQFDANSECCPFIVHRGLKISERRIFNFLLRCVSEKRKMAPLYNS